MIRLVVSNLGCIRGMREVFRSRSFQVSAGEALAVTGPNGAGKSSLLRVIAGLVRRTTGEIVLSGGDADLTLPEQSHYLAHQDPLKAALTVAENLHFWTSYLGDDGEMAQARLDAVGLSSLANLPAAYLSAGQRRRLSLARLAAVKRPVWLLDEPTLALDADGQALLAGLMRDHLAGGGIIIAATHGPLGIEGVEELRLGGQA